MPNFTFYTGPMPPPPELIEEVIQNGGGGHEILERLVPINEHSPPCVDMDGNSLNIGDVVQFERECDDVTAFEIERIILVEYRDNDGGLNYLRYYVGYNGRVAQISTWHAALDVRPIRRSHRRHVDSFNNYFQVRLTTNRGWQYNRHYSENFLRVHYPDPDIDS